HDLVLGQLKVVHGDDLAVLARGEEGRFVGQVRQIGAREAGGPARKHHQVDVLGQGNLARVDAQHAFAAAHVGTVHHHAAVEAAGAQQGRVEDIGAVGGRHQDDAFVRVETVHLDEQLVERLLALVVA